MPETYLCQPAGKPGCWQSVLGRYSCPDTSWPFLFSCVGSNSFVWIFLLLLKNLLMCNIPAKLYLFLVAFSKCPHSPSILGTPYSEPCPHLPNSFTKSVSPWNLNPRTVSDACCIFHAQHNVCHTIDLEIVERTMSGCF